MASLLFPSLKVSLRGVGTLTSTETMASTLYAKENVVLYPAVRVVARYAQLITTISHISHFFYTYLRLLSSPPQRTHFLQSYIFTHLCSMTSQISHYQPYQSV